MNTTARFVVAAAVLTAAFACSARNQQPSVVTQVPEMAEQPGAHFAALSSEPIRRAAMEYPPPLIGEVEAPLSLTASDGTGLKLLSLDARAVVEGPLAFTELHLVFENPQDRELEGRFEITLPERAAISRLAMKLETGWQEAEVVEIQAARRAYEDFLHRKQDPALLEKEAGNEFRARIFPIPARGKKEIIVSYSQELPDAEAEYVLPLRGLPEVDAVNVRALVARRGAGTAGPRFEEVTLRQKGWAPDRDFSAGASPLTALAHGDLALVRVTPQLSATAAPLERALILFDTSASRALGYSAQVDELSRLVAEIADRHGSATQVEVAAFDQEVQTIYRGTAGGFGTPSLALLRARRPLGASDLGAALAFAATRKPGRLIVMSDGVATAGEAEEKELRALVGKTGADRLDVILTGGIRDRAFAEMLARGNLEEDGAILDGDAGATELARRLGQATVSGLDVAVAGATWVWPQTLDGVQPGDAALVYAGFQPGKRPRTVKVTLGGASAQSFEPSPVNGALLSRAAAGARIARLEARRSAADTPEKKKRLRERIVAMSTEHRVLSDHTALLVLETEADYERFGIDRRSLADILVVGKGGVELSNRKKVTTVDVRRRVSREEVDKKKDANKTAESDEEFRAGDPQVAPKPEKVEDAPSADMAADAVEGGVEDGVLGGVAAESVANSAPGQAAGAPLRRRESADARASDDDDEDLSEAGDETEVDSNEEEAKKFSGPAPLTGKMAEINKSIQAGKTEEAVVAALRWRTEEPGDVMALVALGDALTARGEFPLAARAYGSVIDLFPSRADLRRFAGQRLQRLQQVGAALAIDSLSRAVEQRPDHLTGYRLLAYAHARTGDYEAAIAALERGLRARATIQRPGVPQILRDDIGLMAAALVRAQPKQRDQLALRLREVGATIADQPSLRFVLNWETDANDVDFHVLDGAGGHAFYGNRNLESGGKLYADVTNGYGPECFAITGKQRAYPYSLKIHYYSRGPMGYGMGQVEVVEHDGNGRLAFATRPFVVMNDGAYVDLGQVTEPLSFN